MPRVLAFASDIYAAAFISLFVAGDFPNTGAVGQVKIIQLMKTNDSAGVVTLQSDGKAVTTDDYI